MPDSPDRRLVNPMDANSLDASAESSTPDDARDQLFGQMGQPTASPPVPGQVVQPSAEPQQMDWQRVERHNEFIRRLFLFTPRVFVSQTMIGLNLAAFIFMILMGADIMSPSANKLIDLGANFSPLTTSGQWWRLFSCMFLHVGVIHLAFNLWALKVIGPLIERLLGGGAFFATYMFAGLIGSVASIIWNSGAVSAGASGAVFGLFGALVAVLWRRRKEMPLEIVSSLRQQMFSIIGINVFLGFVVPMIDSSAHLGGLLGGAVAALLLSSPITPDGQALRRRRLVLVSPLLILLGVGAVFAMPRNVPDLFAQIDQLIDQHEKADARIMPVIRRYDKQEVAAEQLLELINGPLTSNLIVRRKLFETMRHIPSTHAELHKQFALVFQRKDQSWSRCVDAIRTGDPRKANEFMALRASARRDMQAFKSRNKNQ